MTNLNSAGIATEPVHLFFSRGGDPARQVYLSRMNRVPYHASWKIRVGTGFIESRKGAYNCGMATIAPSQWSRDAKEWKMPR